MIPEKSYTLSSIMNRIKEIFDQRMNEVYFWMKAELMHVKSDRNGHYYLDLVETRDGITVAKSSAQMWNHTAQYLREELGSDFEQIVKPGSEIMCYCKVLFHTVYGLSFIITKVDINFNLGALEQKKKAILDRLIKEDLLDNNKLEPMPRVLQRIALIASPNTSGYEDFVNQLTQNIHGFKFHIETLPTKVQGDGAAAEITKQLQSIPHHDFDVVVILRGGGSKFDLEAFNHYELAKAISSCGLPVITGIGHETDTSIADLAAHTALKTPSAAGAYIVERAVDFNNTVQLMYLNIKRLYDQKTLQHTKDLRHQTSEFAALLKTKIGIQRGNLHTVTNRILNLVNEEQATAHSLLNTASQQLKILPKKQTDRCRLTKNEDIDKLKLYSTLIVRDSRDPLNYKAEQLAYLTKMKLKAVMNKMNELQHYPSLYHPDSILQKGYALVKKEGKPITAETILDKGDIIDVELYNRTFKTQIENIPIWKTLPTRKQN